MCATACPAHCIDIVAAPRPAEVEGRPRKVSGNVRHRRTPLHLLRHVRRSLPRRTPLNSTTLYDLTGLSREQMVFDKEKLLSVFDRPRKPAPTRCAPIREARTASRHPRPSKVASRRAFPNGYRVSTSRDRRERVAHLAPGGRGSLSHYTFAELLSQGPARISTPNWLSPPLRAGFAEFGVRHSFPALI